MKLYWDIDWSYFYYELQMVWYYVYDQFVLAFFEAMIDGIPISQVVCDLSGFYDAAGYFI